MISILENCGYLFRSLRRIPKRVAAVFVLVSLFLLLTLNDGLPGRSYSIDDLSSHDLLDAARTAKFLLKNPVESPYKDKFWEVGQRSKQIGRWLAAVDALPPKSKQWEDAFFASEHVSQQLFPFLQNSTRNPESVTPLADLRKSYEPGSKGIIIAVGGGEESIRFASHLIVSLRQVVHSKLPIQIAYAGDKDLSPVDRRRIQSLRGATDIEFLDVLSVFNDTTLKLQGAGWAIKPFALLASKFEKAILIDADAVFMQKPERMFDHAPFVNKGAYLFHDRLLWRFRFPERQAWWRDQIKEPSDELKKSKVWLERYSEECDSGVVVVDKSKVPIFVGLLHVAWQNTYAVRDEVTYKLGHGDKESWWMGFELSGAPYEFEAHYGSVIGWGDSPRVQDVTMVCSMVIAHLDTNDRLLWYNGGLLENKKQDLDHYRLPSYWMKDGVWEKGRNRKDMSCMKEAQALGLTGKEKTILGESIDAAKEVDATFAKNKK
ncbi:alpha-1,3-mannosyltransferase mnt3 [Fusarium longipes]|uniref:Alpha-1,3-mannosyltransferase mnt3 n=1 Tax=Fusarium longipes TaxID=694270 RepID=A0A395S5M2_9HYPO|nr:alpha-1,3-mannosyltransferase mnt3 [Fusarium longipes]